MVKKINTITVKSFSPFLFLFPISYLFYPIFIPFYPLFILFSPLFIAFYPISIPFYPISIPFYHLFIPSYPLFIPFYPLFIPFYPLFYPSILNTLFCFPWLTLIPFIFSSRCSCTCGLSLCRCALVNSCWSSCKIFIIYS